MRFRAKQRCREERKHAIRTRMFGIISACPDFSAYRHPVRGGNGGTRGRISRPRLSALSEKGRFCISGVVSAMPAGIRRSGQRAAMSLRIAPFRASDDGFSGGGTMTLRFRILLRLPLQCRFRRKLEDFFRADMKFFGRKLDMAAFFDIFASLCKRGALPGS